MVPFCAQSKGSSFTGSDVVGGSEDNSVMAVKRAKREQRIIVWPVAPIKSVGPTKPQPILCRSHNACVPFSLTIVVSNTSQCL